MLDQGFRVAQADGDARQLQAVEQAPAGGQPALQFERHQAAAGRLLALRDLGAGRARQARIEHVGYRRVLAQELRHLQCRFAVALDPQFQRLQAAQHQEGGERRQRRAGEVAQALQADRVDVLLAADHRAGEQVAVAAQVLGGRVQHDVGAVLQRPLQHRRGEGVVDDGQEALAARDGRDGGNVDQPQVGVGRRLEIDRAGLGADGGGHRFRAREVGEHGVDAQARQPLREQREGSAVDDLVDHDLVAALQQRQQRGRDRRHAGGRDHAGLGPFERGQPLFQQGLGRVAGAAVDVARLFAQADAVEGLDAVLGVGGRQVKGRRQRPCSSSGS